MVAPRPGSLAEATAIQGARPYGEESRRFRRTIYRHEDWLKHPQETVEAFFFLSDDGEDFARQVHRAFHERHPNTEVPLVRFELTRLQRPFVRVNGESPAKLGIVQELSWLS